MFKVNNKNIRTTSLTSFWCFIVNFEHSSFTTFSRVPIVDFEQINISWVTTCFPLEFTAELHLGKIGNDKEIKAKTAIGVNPANPVDNYFYGDINKLTLASIAEAFEFNNIGLPKVVLDTGFPNGLEVAFTTNPKGFVSRL